MLDSASPLGPDLTDEANRPDGRQVCDGASRPSSYQVRSVWPVRFTALHRSRATNRTQDTVVTPWPESDRPGAAPALVFTDLAVLPWAVGTDELVAGAERG